jgi:hypothetical protein
VEKSQTRIKQRNKVDLKAEIVVAEQNGKDKAQDELGWRGRYVKERQV